MKFISVFKKRPLSRRLVISVVLFSSTIALVITIIQLYGDYKRDMKILKSDLQSVESVHLDSLVQSVWTSDKQDLIKQLNGILNKPDINYIEIVEQDGTEVHVGKKQSSQFIEKKVAIIKNYKGRNEHIADMTIQSTLNNVYNKIYTKAVDTLILNGVKTLLVSAFILFMIYSLFTRHLNSIAHYLSELNLSKIAKKVDLRNKSKSRGIKDEIDVVVDGITTMQRNLDTAFQELSEKNIQYKRLVESSQAIPWEFNVNTWNFTYIGPQIEAILGYTANAWFQHSFWESRIYPPDKESTLENFSANIKNARDFVLEYRMLDSNDKVVWIRNFVQIIFKKEVIDHLRGYIFNVTEQKQLEDQKQKNQQRLELLVHERTKDLENSVKELEAFSYSVSHDLRTPLRAIEGYSTILLEDYKDKLDADANHYLQRIRLGCHTMSELIDALLDLSRTSVKVIQPQAVNLSEICEQIIAQLKDVDKERKINVKINSDIEVNADRMAMKILMENLIGNSWKYTRNVRMPRIEFGVLNNADIPHPIYFVKDNGIGFEKQFAKNLFMPFQ